MKTVYLFLIGTSGVLDKVPLEVKDDEACEGEVMAELERKHWVLSVGDRIEIRDNTNDPE